MPLVNHRDNFLRALIGGIAFNQDFENINPWCNAISAIVVAIPVELALAGADVLAAVVDRTAGQIVETQSQGPRLKHIDQIDRKLNFVVDPVAID